MTFPRSVNKRRHVEDECVFSPSTLRVTLSHICFANVFIYELGEMQGTVHRRLLEDRQGELKIGAVLLLKQVIYRCSCHTTSLTVWTLEPLKNLYDDVT